MDYIPFLNPQFFTFALVLAPLLFAANLCRGNRMRLPEMGVNPLEVLLVIVNVVVLWGLTQEVVHYFDFRSERELASANALESPKHFTLTVMWALYAIGAIGVGIARESSRIRLAGMALLAVPLFKLFGYDVFLLDKVYRVVAFLTLGVLLLGTGLAYQRYSHTLWGFFYGRQP